MRGLDRPYSAKLLIRTDQEHVNGFEQVGRANPEQKPARPLLLHRRRLLLALLQAFGGRLGRLDFQKYLFLHEMEFADAPAYDFVPFRHGAFSFQSCADRRSLVAAGLILEKEEWQLAMCRDFLGELQPAKRRNVLELKRKYGTLRGRDLVRETYRRFPYYATRSEIASELMDDEGLAAIENERPKDNSECLFTIGYEGISIDTYLNRLMRGTVRVLCDVRRNPFSRKYGFSKATLRDKVEGLGFRYVHLPELGISSNERRSLTTRQDYERLFARYEQITLRQARVALARVAALVAEHRRVALTKTVAKAGRVTDRAPLGLRLPL